VVNGLIHTNLPDGGTRKTCLDRGKEAVKWVSERSSGLNGGRG